MRPGNVAEALELARSPLYFVEAGRLAPGLRIPGTVAVLPGTEPPPWEAARLLLEEP
jgi:hypothetical protein